MVIHEDDDSPMEVPTRRPSERSKYIVVKNHVREVRVGGDETPANTSDPPAHQHKRKKCAQTIRNESKDHLVESTSEETKDLEELRRVYFECKRVLTSIERKYGSRLNLLTEEYSTDAENYTCRKKQKLNDSSACTCPKNKRLVFDESGIESEWPACGDHVCVARAVSARDRLKIEREGACDLPDSIPQLALLLRDPQLGAELRRPAVERMRTLRAELNNQLRYERSALVEQVKRDPDTTLAFIGTNLSSLPGYN